MNGERLTLRAPLTVGDTLLLTSGIIYTPVDTAALMLADDALALSASDSSYVEGRVVKVGNDGFVFPVGRNGKYRPIAMSAPSSTTAHFRGEYFEHSADADFPLSSRDTTLVGISSNEFWTMERLASTSNVSVTLAWDSITSCAMDTALSAVRVAGWDGTKWADRGNGGTTGTIDHGTVVSSAAATVFHAFTVGHGMEEMGCDDCNAAMFVGATDTCLTALGIVEGDNWLSFEAQGSNALFQIPYSDVEITAVEVFEHCRDGSAISVSLDADPDSTLIASFAEGLTQGKRYSVRVVKDSVGLEEIVLCIKSWNTPLGGCPPPPCDLIANGGFECSELGASMFHPDVNGVDSWTCAWGSPDISGTTTGRYAHMWAQRMNGVIRSESIRTNVNGSSGDYVLSFRYQAQTHVESIFFRLTNENDYSDCLVTGGSVMPSFDNDVLLELTPASGGIFNGSWWTWTGVVTADAPLGWLVIHPWSNSTTNSTDVWIDNVSLTRTVPDIDFNIQHATCGSAGDGSVTVSFDPHPQGLTWTWSPPVASPTTSVATGLSEGQYTVILTTADGCTNEATATVDLLANTVPSIQFSEQHVSCFGGNDGSLTVSFNPSQQGHSWTWSPTVAAPNTVTATGLSAGQYTVILTTAAGCTTQATATVTETAVPPIAIDTEVELTCNSPQTFSVDDPETGETYQWTVPSGATISSGQGTATVTVDWGTAAETGGQVCVTAQTCGQEACVYVAGCCEPPEGATVFTDATLSTAQTFTGTDIVVHGTLTLDDPTGTFVFSGCDILMSPNALIRAIDGTSITLTDATHVYACTDMHVGIQVYHADGRFVMNEGSLIEDAFIGADLRNNAFFDIDGARFDNNWGHVHVQDYTAFPQGTVKLTNTEMECTSTLTFPFVAGVRTFSGVSVRNSVKWTLGTGVTIDNAAYGIHLWDSPLTVTGNTVSNAHHSHCAVTQECGAGLYSIDHTGTSGLIVVNCEFYDNSRAGVHVLRGSNAAVRTCIFNNNPLSVLSDRTVNFEASGNEVSNTDIGFWTLRSTSPDIVGNQPITDTRFGIVSMFDREVSITNNTHSNPTLNDGFGISVVSPVSSSPWGSGPPSVNVRNNNISNVRRGIWLLNASYSYLMGNNIHVRETATSTPPAQFGDPAYGIYMDNSILSWVANNHMGSDVDASPWRWWDMGLYAGSSAANFVLCNSVENVHKGLGFHGSAASTLMLGNKMDGHIGEGIHHAWGTLATQGGPTQPTDNVWLGDFNYHTTTFQATQGAEIYVQEGSDNTPYQPDDFTPLAQPDNFPTFQILLTESNPSATSPIDCPFDFSDYRNYSYLYKVALDSVVYSGDDSIVKRRLAHLELFRAIRTDSLLQTDSILIAFADSFVGTDLGRLDTLDARLAPELDKTDVGRLSTAANLIPVTDTVAALWKEVLYLGFDTWADADTLVVLSSADTARLTEIALLCPYEFGPAVYRARGLLFKPDTAWFAMGHVCELGAEPIEPSMRLAEEESGEEMQPHAETFAKVYPNPTSGVLHISLKYAEEDIVFWRVLDLTGRSVSVSKEHSGRSEQVQDMSALRPGIYLLQLHVNGISEKVWRIALTGSDGH
jgi:hypothetical protein